MRALALESFDAGPKVVEVRDPVIVAGEVLVRLAAASVNAFDLGVAAGSMKAYMPYEFPAVIGGDISGRVEAIGDGVEGFAVGDRVFGMMGSKGSIHDGSFAELANPQAAFIVPTPDGLTDPDAGSLAVAGTTAMSAIEAVKPIDGSTVLIIGATGGVGSFAIQLAALRGAHVIATVRPGDEDFVTGLGGAETVDYTGDVAAEIRRRYPNGIDGVIDAVNRDRDVFAGLVGLVGDGGRATSVVGSAGDATELGGVAVSNTGGNPAYLSDLADLVVKRQLRAAIRKTYALADAEQALHDFVNDHTVGKLLITMP